MAKLKDGSRVYGTLTVDTALTVSTDATITGNLIVSGNTVYTNVETLAIEDPLISLGGGANAAALTVNDNKDRGLQLQYFDTGAKTAFMGWDASAGEFAVASNVTISNEVVTSFTYGNIKAGYVIGNGYALTNITGANVDGTVASATNASTAGTVTGNAQANITSVGTLTGLVVGNATANTTFGNGNITATGAVSTGNLTVNGDGNVTGNLTIGGTLYANVSGSTSAPGQNTQVVFNDAGTSNATAEFTFNKGTNTVSTVNLVLSGNANVGNNINMTNSSASIKGTTLTANGSTTLNLEGSTSNITLDSSGAIIKSSGGNVKLDNSGDLTLGGTGNLLLPNANISSTGTANLGGALNVSQTANVANVIARNFAENQIAYSDGTSKLVGAANFTYTAGTLAVPTLNATDISAANITANTLTDTRVTFAGVGGKLVDSANLTFNTTTKTLTVDNVTMSGTANAAEVIITSLTSGRIPFADTDKSLTDSANLTFANSVLTVNGNVAATNILTDNLLYANGAAWDLQQAAGGNGQIQFNDGANNFTASANLSFNTAGNVLTTDGLQLNGDANIGNVTARNLTSGRVTLAGSGGKLEDSTNLTFNGNTLSVTGNISMGGAANITNANYFSATTANVTTLNASGSANVGIDLTVSGNANITGTLKAGDTTIAGNLTVTGTTTSVNTVVTQLTDPVFELGGGANGAVLTSDDGMDRGLVMHRYSGNAAVDTFMGWDNSASEFILAKNVTVANNVVTLNGANANAQAANLGDLRLGNIFAYNANFGGVVFSEGNVTLGAGSKFIGNLEGNVSGNISGNVKVSGGNGAIQFTTNYNANANIGDLGSDGSNFYYTDSTNTLNVDNITVIGNITGTLTTNAQPNVTSLGTLTGLSIDGNLSIGNGTPGWGIKTDNLYYSNGVAWDLQQAAGSNNEIQFNSDDNFSSSSSFTFDPASNTLAVTGTANVSGNVNAGNVTVSSLSNTYVTFAGASGKLVNSANLTFDPTSNTLTVTGTSNVVGTLNASNVTIGGLTGGRITFAEQTTNRLIDSANLTFDPSSNTLTTTTANVGTVNATSVAATGNVTAGNVYANAGTIGATYLTGTLTTNAQPNVTSVGTLTGLAVNGTANLSAVGNVIITGGTAGQYLRATNSSGGLEYATLDTSIIANGTSNVSIPSVNGNVVTNVGGSTILTVSGTGANVSGVITATGNVDANNINASNVITATGNVVANSSITGTVKVTGGMSATGNIYTGQAVGFANNNGGTASAAYIQFNASANSLDFIFN